MEDPNVSQTLMNYDITLRKIAEEARTTPCTEGWIATFRPCGCCGSSVEDHPNDHCLFDTPEDAEAELQAMVERRIDGEPE